MQCWNTFLPSLNCESFFDDHWCSDDLLELYTDVSKLFFGAYFQGAWLYSTFKESLLVGQSLSKNCLQSSLHLLLGLHYSQASASCSTLAVGGSNRCPHIITLACYAFFLCERHSIEISAIHLPGAQNNRADALSRLQISPFQALSSVANEHVTSLPEISLTPFR